MGQEKLSEPPADGGETDGLPQSALRNRYWQPDQINIKCDKQLYSLAFMDVLRNNVVIKVRRGDSRHVGPSLLFPPVFCLTDIMGGVKR